MSEARRKHLKQLMAARQIVKTYYAITNGVPNTREGVINIPIGEGHIDDRYRPTLRPDYKASKTITNKSNSKRKCRYVKAKWTTEHCFWLARKLSDLIIEYIYVRRT